MQIGQKKKIIIKPLMHLNGSARFTYCERQLETKKKGQGSSIKIVNSIYKYTYK